MGTQQTEIDAGIALGRPSWSRSPARRSPPFFDSTLQNRFEQARQVWETKPGGHRRTGDGDREQIMAVARSGSARSGADR